MRNSFSSAFAHRLLYATHCQCELLPSGASRRSQPLRHLLLITLFSTLVQSCENQPPADITDPGQLLYLGHAKKEVNCARCHGPEGAGGQEAPDIRTAFDKYSETDILFFIENGKGEGKNTMPAMHGEMNERELQQLLKFLRTLKPETTITKPAR